MNLGIFKFIFFGVLKHNAVFFDEIKQGIPPDGGAQVLLDKIISPEVLLRNGGLLLFFLFLFFLAWAENPIQHFVVKGLIKYEDIISKHDFKSVIHLNEKFYYKVNFKSYKNGWSLAFLSYLHCLSLFVIKFLCEMITLSFDKHCLFNHFQGYALFVNCVLR